FQMRILRFALVGCLVLGLAACSGDSGKKESDKDGDKKEAGGKKGEQDGGSRGSIDAAKLVGTWVVTKSAGLRPGATGTVVFSKDGKMSLTVCSKRAQATPFGRCPLKRKR